MRVEIFLMLLSVFTTTDSLCVEAIKKTLGEKYTLSYNLIALILGVLIGIGGCFIYYILNDALIDLKSIIFALLMGIASALSSTVSYDKVKQLIEQIKM